MALITPDYFVRDILIENADKGSIIASLTDSINVYEPEYLDGVMGVSFAQLFLANISDSRFQDLLNGKVYEYNGESYRWQGLVNGTTKTSPIADYVFYQYVKNNAQTISGVGAVTSNAENSTRVSPVDKMVLAWRKMVKVNQDMYYFLERNKDTYPEFDTNIWYYSYATYYRYFNTWNDRINPFYYHNGGGNRVGI
ncbi:hypothetical protein VF04_35035 [Nostoc linckia z7]|uniref:Uncharacterized protein n=1 Tax=Nostoc linckia z7 TaxID=1628745 RepID=A0ABX4KDJ2_NOSLI|nr:hypothetical protein [Nostoc linckia]PHJ53862.1 hypothetical protein VF02_37065 [Nostoc linckia z1]PHJ59278.1 hypothetical protein VF05_32310 [Nostoc linckia z3]PHJ63673.1 hypothetical protein VF03_30185 [Nostoc linckia z2]PHJ73865.1 hypothetical protein VF06_35705 [Nostoc linckia z4]PHJ87194.1 hypothetical protein VF04_35035 [Nostoc linckia z7]